MSSDLIARTLPLAEEQWLRAGGHALRQQTPIARASRHGFTMLQTAAAVDQMSTQLHERLRDINASKVGQTERAVRSKPRQSQGVSQVHDDVSDGSDVQGALVASNVRPGKQEVQLSAPSPTEHRAPNGSLRLLAADVVSPDECDQLLAAGIVAMAGAFSRCGQTTLGISPALQARMQAPRLDGVDTTVHDAAATAAISETMPMLYCIVERVRRRVASAFGADVATLRVSDATFTRLQPVSSHIDAENSAGMPISDLELRRNATMAGRHCDTSL